MRDIIDRNSGLFFSFTLLENRETLDPKSYNPVYVWNVTPTLVVHPALIPPHPAPLFIGPVIVYPSLGR